MSDLFRSLTLPNSQQLDSSGATSLHERLYYADGRQNPATPATAALRGCPCWTDTIGIKRYQQG